MERKKKIIISLIFIIIFIIGSLPFIFISVIVKNEGIWNPNPYYQRYRLDEYPVNENFFQWWYFSLKDYKDNQTFAFCYSISRPVDDLTYRGLYMLFAAVTPSSKYHIYYNYSLNDLEYSKYNDLDIANSRFKLEVISDDFYHIEGNMNQPKDVWVSEGINSISNISWNLDINRIIGWYGQADIENMVRDFSLISWNTYSYDSKVNGTVSINGTTFNIENSPRFRMYCDMNWGKKFPSGTPAIEYPWGWFYTGIPNANPQEDFSIIAGVGRSESSFFITGDMYAKFASIYLSGKKIDARSAKIQDNKMDSGIQVINPSSDGKTILFKIDRSHWLNYTDLFGIAKIPLMQIVTIETTNYKITMNFTSKPQNYNRLLFPTDGYCFSDFEALGVNCSTKIYRKYYSPSDICKWNPSYNLTKVYNDVNAGLEYGYSINVQI